MNMAHTNLSMKNVIAVLLLLVGLVFLGVGYNASGRLESRMFEQHMGDSPANRPQIEVLTEFVERQDCATRGAIQYCTGWLMIAAAGIVFSLGRNEKSIPPAA
jgi:hypothetical protein